MDEKLSEIQRTLTEADLSSLPGLRISVLRNITVEAVEPYLRFLAYESGLAAEVRFGEFDNVVQEALGADEDLLRAETDCVLIFLQLETLSPALGRGFAALSPSGVEEEIDRVRGLVRTVVSAIRERTSAMVLWHGFETPLYPALGIVDGNHPGGQSDAIRELNRFVRQELAARGNAYYVDLDRCRARIGEEGFYDRRYWHIGRAPYSRRGLREIAAEDFKFIRALAGKTRKCLVMDCDNVLWGGIVGEDGLEGIKLGQDHPGSPYHEFQREALGLHHRGVILALNSKNNEDDVWEVFDNHPGMVLGREHIAAWRINWQDKAANLRELVAELNIGMQSVVYVDDSEFEVDLVRGMLPEVLVVHLPVTGAVGNRERLAALGVFDTLTLSDEDRRRGAMYRAESERKKLQVEITDLDTYYRSLEMSLEIRLADTLAIPRIAQLTQKTNQFNLTTRRYSEEDIRRFCTDETADVISVRLTDRFGDSGIVGVCILRYGSDEAVFDTLLMSCRVLGRKVEDAFVLHCLRRARARGAGRAIGLYVPTAKNHLSADFFGRLSFARSDPSDSDGVHRFELDLGGELPPPPRVFKLIDAEVDAEAVPESKDSS